MLSRLPLMQVSTIHGLCGRVAREHPVESGAGLNFRVLDEAESAEWLEAHLSGVLAELPVEVLLEVPGRIRAEVIRTLLEDPTSAGAALEVAAGTAGLDPTTRAMQAWSSVQSEWTAALATLAAVSGPAGDVLETARQAALGAGPLPVLGDRPAGAADRAGGSDRQRRQGLGGRRQEGRRRRPADPQGPDGAG